MLTSYKISDFNIDDNYTIAEPLFIKEKVDRELCNILNEHWGRDVLGREEINHHHPVLMQSNDYLSIAKDKRIALAKVKRLLEIGNGNAISRIFTHHYEDLHNTFEKRTADLLGADDAVLVMSGYNANTAIVQVFADRGTPIYIDIMAHASLWEGILCAQAKARPFRHNNAQDLAKKIAHYGPGLVIVDSLYSTNGNLCPLEDIVEVAEQGGCAIIVDETHSFGCHGKDGAGMVVEYGLVDRVHFRTIGLSKAAAARGGIVAGSARNMEFFRYEARPMIFSTSVLNYEIAGFNKTLDIFAQEPWRRRSLHCNHSYLREGLLSIGYDVRESESQIISIVTGTKEDTVIFRKFLCENGIYGSVFCPPATPENKCLIRFTINATLEKEQLDRTIEVCAEARVKLNMDDWPCILDTKHLVS